MTMTTSFQDIILRSRITILEMLKDRGYDTKPYEKLGAEELAKLSMSADGLRMDLQKEKDPEKKAIVLYKFDSIKTSIGNGDLVKTLLDKEKKVDPKELPESGLDPATTEVIVVYKMAEKVLVEKMTADNMETYDKAALDAWTKHKFRIQFWPIQRLVNNPMKHVLQPKFEKVNNDEDLKTIMKEWYVTKKTQFPYIKFHNDPVARFMGLLPGDVVKIIKPSVTAGEYIKYRVCVP